MNPRLPMLHWRDSPCPGPLTVLSSPDSPLSARLTAERENTLQGKCAALRACSQAPGRVVGTAPLLQGLQPLGWILPSKNHTGSPWGEARRLKGHLCCPMELESPQRHVSRLLHGPWAGNFWLCREKVL